jgi:hypothetical protein
MFVNTHAPCDIIVPAPKSDYVMINSLEIKNFRCFKNLKLGGLKRFNVIVGGSGTGKTALIESIFLAGAANPEVYFRLRKWRGYGDSIRLTGSRDSYESLFADMFFDFDKTSGALIQFVDSVSGSRSVSISYSGKDEYTLPLRGTAENVFVVDPITFRWKTPTGNFESRVETKEGSLKFSGSGHVHPVWILSAATGPESYAQHFSDLSKRRASQPVIDKVKEQFPFVRDMSLESLVGELMLYADVDYLDAKLPVTLLSAGINKYLSILISIASNPGGVLLIDEFENGFYYKNLEAFLRSIYLFAEEQKVQIIASTHSYELLQALGRVMADEEGRENQFTLLRTERTGHETSIERIDGSAYRAAVEQGFEIR